MTYYIKVTRDKYELIKEMMKVKDIVDNYKPCPFCGNADIEIYGNTEIYDPKSRMVVKKVNIGCPDCGVWYDYLFDDELEAIKQWNERITE